VPWRDRHPTAPVERREGIIHHAARSIVSTSIHCQQCGYDLKGLAAATRCPECGLEVLETLTQLVDPEASRLPRLRDPRGTAIGLLGLACTHLVVCVIIVLPRVLPLVQPNRRSVIADLEAIVHPRIVASAIAGLGLIWLWYLARGPADEPSTGARQSVRLMLAGQVGWALTAWLPALVEPIAPGDRVIPAMLESVAVPFAIMSLVGLRGVLDIVGHRSRAYRTAQGGKQGVSSLIAALASGAVANFLNGLAVHYRLEWLELVTNLLFAASTLLLVIGLGYLVVNCIWINRSLRRPPPRLDEILAPVEG